ncbi:hypothetical protein, partial [Paenibacillus polysaccharolyticus]|uniref:hypothetical protein n=1 Tax=Paenibacillus polysaccharolyticus TaxID=582692 RepID=UPI00280C384E
MFDNIVSDGIKSFSRMRKYMEKSSKNKVFNSPAVSVIDKIVSKNTKLKYENTLSKINNSIFFKKNKSLAKIVKDTGSMIVTVANQKSYHNGYDWNKKTKSKDTWIENNVKWLGKKAVSGKDAAFSW